MFLKLKPGAPIEQIIRQLRTLLIVTLILVAALYACVADLMAGGPVSAWIARASAEQAQKQREADAYQRYLQENR